MSQRILPGAEPFRFDGGPSGVLLLHGFTGSPASMRPMGEWLAERGLAVEGPRLPGHGTSIDDLARVSWQDWEREAEDALDELSARCTSVVVAGLSMGGGLALRLGAKHPDRIRGIVVVNPYVQDSRLAAAPVARLFMRTRKGVGNDIKRPGQDEVCYERIPVVALVTLAKLLKAAEADLPSMTLPLLLFSSVDDHVVKPSNSTLVMARVGSTNKEMVRLANSYHVATLDYDAEAICERTLRFVGDVGSPAA
jgi:carboxylesterase